MGPRSDERGNARAKVIAGNAGAASMGPRSDERGNQHFTQAVIMVGLAMI